MTPQSTTGSIAIVYHQDKSFLTHELLVTVVVSCYIEVSGLLVDDCVIRMSMEIENRTKGLSWSRQICFV